MRRAESGDDMPNRFTVTHTESGEGGTKTHKNEDEEREIDKK